MKNKILIPTVLLALSITSACSKDCEPKFSTCSETPPTEELCQAAFERWFFNEETNECEKIGYSGCSQKGFASKQDCEECKYD